MTEDLRLTCVIHLESQVTAIIAHSINCTGQIEWEKMKTKVEPNRFDRKVREALEMQHQDCGPSKGGINLNDGQYVTTKSWTPFFKYLKRSHYIANNVDTIASNIVTVDAKIV